jgi:TldD protein
MSLPRATNTVVAAGPASPADLLHVPPEGLLVVRAWASGQVDIATGAFVFVAADAELRHASGAVVILRDVVIHGDALDLLERVVAVGADVGADPATCGKGDQVVPVGFASPTMRVQDVTWQTR